MIQMRADSDSRTQTLHELLAPVATRIRQARRERQLTWRDVAGRAGLRATTLRQVEAGGKGFTAATAGRIARALGIDEEELYPGGRPDVFWARLGANMRRQYQAIPVGIELLAA